LHFLRASVFHYQRLGILRDSIGYSSWLLLLFAFFTSFHFQFWASPYITGLNQKSEWKLTVVWICSQLLYSISTVSIYYGTQSDIWEKSYCLLNLLRVSVLNVVHLDILQDSIRLSSKKLLSFKFAKSFYFQFRESWIIKGVNWTSESKLIVIWICSELLYSISSILIYYEIQSDIWVKSYCRLNLLNVSVFNFVHLDILQDWIGHSSKILLSFKFAQSFCFQFRASWIIKGHNRTSESKVIVVWICWQLLFSILRVSNY